MRLYFHYMSLHFKSRMAYRWSFFIECLGQLLIGLNLFLGLVFITGRFGAGVRPVLWDGSDGVKPG